MNAEAWIERNTMECEPYEARISRQQCADNQANQGMFHCPCPRAVTDLKPRPERRVRKRLAGLGHWLDTGVKPMHPATEGGEQPPSVKKKTRPAPAKKKRPAKSETPAAPPAELWPMPALRPDLEALAAAGHFASGKILAELGVGALVNGVWVRNPSRQVPGIPTGEEHGFYRRHHGWSCFRRSPRHGRNRAAAGFGTH